MHLNSVNSQYGKNNFYHDMLRAIVQNNSNYPEFRSEYARSINHQWLYTHAHIHTHLYIYSFNACMHKIVFRDF